MRHWNFNCLVFVFICSELFRFRCGGWWRGVSINNFSSFSWISYFFLFSSVYFNKEFLGYFLMFFSNHQLTDTPSKSSMKFYFILQIQLNPIFQFFIKKRDFSVIDCAFLKHDIVASDCLDWWEDSLDFSWDFFGEWE